jgi:hypothetical protein
MIPEPAPAGPWSPQQGHRSVGRSKPTALAKPRRPLEKAQITRFGRNEVANRGTPRAVQIGGYLCTERGGAGHEV